MDAYLEEEEVNADQSGWSFTSKALLLSNVLVSILIVIVLSFTLMGGSSLESGVELEVSDSVGQLGGLNNERPSGVGDDVLPANNLVPLDEDSGEAGRVTSEAYPPVLEGEFDTKKPSRDGGIDQSILAIVDGCLKQEITGTQCDETFVREDIGDYCEELDNLYDRCYVMSALMNKDVDYCTPVKDNILEGKCIFSLSG